GEGEAKGSLFILHPGYARMILHAGDRLLADAQGRTPVLLQPEAVVRGVYKVDGVPQRDAAIQLFQPHTERLTGLDQTFEISNTNDKGEFEFTNLAPGQYRVYIQGGAKEEVTLATGEHKWVELGTAAQAASIPAAATQP